jgi:very-short-patch-repair endonuclease
MADAKHELETAWKLITGQSWPFVPEHKFHPERRWRFDWADLEKKIAIEIEGVVWFGGKKSRHQTASGIEADCEKYNSAIELGWRVLRYTQQQVRKNPAGAIEQIQRVSRHGGAN